MPSSSAVSAAPCVLAPWLHLSWLGALAWFSSAIGACGRSVVARLNNWDIPASLLDRPIKGTFSVIFDCTDSPGFGHLLMFVTKYGGYRDPRVFKVAWSLWNDLDFNLEGETGSTDEDDVRAFRWRSAMNLRPYLDEWILHILEQLGRVLMQNTSASVTADAGADGAIPSTVPGEEGEAKMVGLRPLDCPYGFLMMHYALLVGFQQQEGRADVQHQVADALMASIEALLDVPYHTFDFMESTTWQASVHDIAVNLESDVHWPSFQDYVEAKPVPPAWLPPWHAESPAHLFSSATLGAAGSKLRSLTAPLTLSIVQLHDGTAAELWGSASAALRLLAGLGFFAAQGQDDSLGAGAQQVPAFYFTKVKALRGTDAGEMITNFLATPFEELQDVRRAGQRGELSLAEIRDEWLPRVAPSLFTADAVICSEPFWLCPLLASHREPGSRMVGVLHMALLNEFPFKDEGSLTEFWGMFYRMVAERTTHFVVACRITAEQIAHQTGVRTPYVPFLGLYVKARYAPSPEHKALLFRNNRQHMLAFRGAMRLYLSEACGHDCPVEIVDMNDMPKALPFAEIAKFRAVVLLPHGPNALRLSDLYAARIPLVVPGEPLVHKFLWATRTFGGFDADAHYRAEAPRQLRQQVRPLMEDLALPPPEGHPPFTPFNFLRAWSLHRFIDDKRYWYQYTEWATLPHLTTFLSLPDLLRAVLEMTPDVAHRISERMAGHQALLVADALTWWQGALGFLIVGMVS